MNDSKLARPRIVVMVGMGRAGSTTLHYQLRQHPGVVLPFNKETYYFSFNYDRGVEWFLDLYRAAKPGQIGFDISPNYCVDHPAIARVLDFDPQTQALLSVREPVSWILSFYNQLSGTFLRMPPFQEFVHGYDVRIGGKTVHAEFPKDVASRIVAMCQRAFGDNLLVYDFELFGRDPLRVCRAIESFVGLPPYYTERNFRNVRLNASDRHHNMYFYALVNNQRVIATLRRLVPERLLRLAREKYYLAVQKDGSSDPRQRHSKENVQLAEELFGEDRTRIRELFAENPIQLGSGAPFVGSGKAASHDDR